MAFFSLSIIVPLYNEAGRFQSTYFKSMLDALPGCRVFFVDDGSTDSTLALITEFSDSEERSDVVTLPTNLGKACAVQAGVREANSRFPNSKMLGVIDADGSFSIDDLRSMCEVLDKRLTDHRHTHTIAIFPSKKLIESLNIFSLRSILSTLSRGMLKLGYDKPVPRDTQVGMKVFSNSPELRRAFDLPFQTRWFYEWELLLRAHSNQVDYIPFELTTFRRVPDSRLGGRDLTKLLIELLYIKRLQLGLLTKEWISGKS